MSDNYIITDRLAKNDKKIVEDFYFTSTEIYQNDFKTFSNAYYLRVNSVAKVKFTNIHFDHSFFDGCNLKDVIFVDCSFVGCKFINTNLKGSSFTNCDMRYVLFENTIVDDEIFLSAPREHNIRISFARSLRVNYRSLGDINHENYAISIELDAINQHLFNSWCSSESYYRRKYKGFERFKQFMKWVVHKFNDLMWGHGESIQKALVFVFLVLICTFLLVSIFSEEYSPLQSLNFTLQAFIGYVGVSEPTSTFLEVVLIFLTLFRYFVSGMYFSILIKRFSGRL